MARVKPEQPERLAQKLKQIRLTLGWTQEKMFEVLQKEAKEGAKMHFGYITRYESGSRVPSLLILLAYARIAGISTDILIDDELDLPSQI